ncbi:putative nucleotidyltransferase, ribonuclease H [Tanacetum coccineum]|uniref:Nucleotidyltransferase, ribonuclease H n=1 Tax=Tanacetum coccineum TaxID=301880 RepID=A0ABQ5C7F9_9ASTR
MNLRERSKTERCRETEYGRRLSLLEDLETLFVKFDIRDQDEITKHDFSFKAKRIKSSKQAIASYNPNRSDLRREILKECHDSKWAGHPGITRTLALVEGVGTFYRPRLGDYVLDEMLVKADELYCQQDNIEQKKLGGLLEPLSTPKVTMEGAFPWTLYIFLPRSPEEGGSIIVVVDRFLKYGTFIAAPPDVMADDTAKLFFKNVVKQTEMVNASIRCSNLYLRHYVSANKHDWAKLLDVPQLSYNMQQSKATGKSPFELVTGSQPLTPNALSASYEGNEEVDEKRRHVEFKVGDQVMVNLLPQQFKSLRKVHTGLIRRYEGPFPVIGRIGKWNSNEIEEREGLEALGKCP